MIAASLRSGMAYLWQLFCLWAERGAGALGNAFGFASDCDELRVASAIVVPNGWQGQPIFSQLSMREWDPTPLVRFQEDLVGL